jgi:DNA-directed RNA polymerase II subunit RPB2
MGQEQGVLEPIEKRVNHGFEVTMEFENVTIRKPTIFENNGSVQPMLPNDARLRNLTYAAPLYVDVKVTTTFIDNTQNGIRNTKQRTFPNVHLGKIPVMVGSKYCLLQDQRYVHPSMLGECAQDPGGYFIIQGGERVIISQERMSENRPFVFRNNRNINKEIEVIEIKAIGPTNEQVPKSNTVKLVYHPKNPLIHLLRANIPRIKAEFPLFILFRALGVETDKDIVDLILGPDGDSAFDAIFDESIQEGSVVRNKEEALIYLSHHMNTWAMKNQKQLAVKDILNDELFPHVGGEDMNYEKACLLAHMTRKLLWVSSGRIPNDDRDGFPNKRVDLPGFLLANLFRTYFSSKMVKDIRSSLAKEIHNGSWKASGAFEDIVNVTNIYKIIKSTIIDVGLRSSLATGNFGSAKLGGPTKIGVSQVLNRLNFLSSISHLRRCATPIEKTGKLIQPRKLHNTQIGFVCPAETPEGHSVGVVKNMASTSLVSIYSNPAIVLEFIKHHGLMISVKDCDIEMLHKGTRVFVNGVWLGMFAPGNSKAAVEKLRKAKRGGSLHIHTSIVWKPSYKELWISTEAGRFLRPVYNGAAVREILGDASGELRKQVSEVISWDQMLMWESPQGHNLIEYVDPGETDTSLIAMTYQDCLTQKETTHCEIHPSVFLGTLASNIPFPDHNQSPRNAYQSAMGKQAMGIYAYNYRERFDAMAHVLCYPNVPLVNPYMSKFYGGNQMMSGQNIVVAIMTYGGYNQEDSIMINRGALDRGIFRSIFYRTYKDEEKKNQSSNEEERFCKPDQGETKQMRHANYNKLAADGFVPENSFVDCDDILIGKVVPLKMPTGKDVPVGIKKYRDVSRMLRNNEFGYVDKIFKNRNGEGYSFVKIRMRQDRMPEIGDKFSSRHGQKGTCGLIINTEDMPQTANGIVPDIIINPHAIPSRMTIAQLMETLLGRLGCEYGALGDGSPFNSVTVDWIAEMLRDGYGIEPYSNEILYNGHNGRQMETKIFMGPCFYQRLRHCSADKLHSRASGPLVMLTRQPAEGRAREGGLRFGEMERDCVASHGVAEFTKERFVECSDGFDAWVCNDCGLLGIVNPEQGIWLCKGCQNTTNFSNVQIPYASKLFLQELESMCISSRMITETQVAEKMRGEASKVNDEDADYDLEDSLSVIQEEDDES